VQHEALRPSDFRRSLVYNAIHAYTAVNVRLLLRVCLMFRAAQMSCCPTIRTCKQPAHVAVCALNLIQYTANYMPVYFAAAAPTAAAVRCFLSDLALCAQFPGRCNVYMQHRFAYRMLMSRYT
jgi:hypothetical protein